MKILVLIKQVPETGNVHMDPETGTLVRDGVESIINPLDLYAVESALRLKKKHGASITAMTMGPKTAEKCLREAIAMGCDDGVLLSSREFAGSDTWSTSKILSTACKKLGDYDLILAGERATDGDTAQVGPEVAAMLNVPLATYVSKVVDSDEDGITVERLVEKGYETLRLPFPALITVLKEIAVPRLPTLKGKQYSRFAALRRLSIDELPEVKPETIGLAGSPTRVLKIGAPKIARCGISVSAANEKEAEAAVDSLIKFLKEKNLVPSGGKN